MLWTSIFVDRHLWADTMRVCRRERGREGEREGEREREREREELEKMKEEGEG